MTNLKQTKKAFLSSIIALVLCFSMLLGTTYAWFTDSASSSGNKIQAGTLDVDLYLWTANDESGRVNIGDDKTPIFGVNSDTLAQKAQDNAADTLWEPGKTQTVYLSIRNNGNLDLKYKVAIDVSKATNDLEDFMEYAITPDAEYGTRIGWAGGEKVKLGTNNTQAQNVPLKAGEEHFFALSIHMDELATNAQMNGTIEFDIKVLAGQLASELDSLGNTYDADAVYDGYTEVAPPAAGVAGIEVPVYNSTKNDEIAGSNVGNKDKIGSASIPADAIDPNAETVSVQIEETEYDLPQNVTIAAGSSKVTYNVNVEGIKANNTAPIKIELRIPTGLDKSAIKLYHYGNEITEFNYNHSTGMVTFETASFSPFTIVYDLNKTYVAPVVTPGMAYPTAKVEYASKYVNNATIEWDGYGKWNPVEGLETNLETAFVFTCPKNLSDEIRAAYADWYCDFYISLDRELEANQLFLGGNYGTFGYIGFHYAGETIEANSEIGLLESVTANPWTYADVETFVKTFICGAGDVNDALDGATITVTLRLTNPNNKNDVRNVNTVSYTFGGSSKIDGREVITSAEDIKLNVALNDVNFDSPTNAVTVKDIVLVDDAQIVYTENETFVLSNVTGNLDHDVIVRKSAGAILIENCDFTLADGAKLITVAEGGDAYQVFMANVTINGVLMNNTNVWDYLEGVKYCSVALS